MFIFFLYCFSFFCLKFQNIKFFVTLLCETYEVETGYTHGQRVYLLCTPNTSSQNICVTLFFFFFLLLQLAKIKNLLVQNSFNIPLMATARGMWALLILCYIFLTVLNSWHNCLKCLWGPMALHRERKKNSQTILNPFIHNVLFYPCKLDKSIFHLRVTAVKVSFLFHFQKNSCLQANSLDPDHILCSAMSDLGLHYMPKSHIWDTRRIWVN